KCSTCGNLYSGDLCSKCMAGFAQKSTDPTAPPEDLPLKPGQSFHGLEILELLGRGGMGVVYKARQPALDRFVALKILPQKMALDPDFQNRFIREAKALGSLSHPNIVAVYDFGAEGGFFFFAMEYIDGTNLRQILRDRKMSPEQGLKIVPQLCDALEYAHGEGVVHRDIKPENILLDKKGRVKIADFGLAKLVGADAPANLTMTNMVMGTPHYMAPEQVENPKGVDHRADIYAIGVVLYEMLTGELPIGRFEMPSKKVQIDVRLDDVVLRALEKSPDRRYQNASDVKDAVTKATAISTAESYSPTVITPKPAVKNKMPVAGLIALVAVVIAVVAIVALTQGPKPPPTIAVTPPKTPVVEPPAVAGPLDLTPLYFGPDERPARYIFQGVGKGLPRNPMPAKEPGEIDTLIQILDDIGLQNIARSDVKQGYLAAWFRFEAAFIALETAIPDRIEREFLALAKLDNKWTYKKGPLLVIAWTPRKERRTVFVDLVNRLQKKLGLPVEAPEIPIENLKMDRSELPSDWVFRESAAQAPAPAGLQARFEASMEPTDGADLLEYRVWVGKTAQDADAFAAQKLGFAGRRKVEVRRAGRTVAALALTGNDLGAFEKVAKSLRRYMGFPDHTFETVALAAEDLPSGYSFDKTETDPARVIQLLGVSGVLASDVTRAAYYRFKPAGMAFIVEAPESKTRTVIDQELRKTGISFQTDSWVIGLEGPDDTVLDAIEDMLRDKIAWDHQHNRYVTIPKVLPAAAELPQGYSLGTPKADKRLYENELKGPNGVLRFRLLACNEWPDFEKNARAETYKPGELQLIHQGDYVSLYISGGSEADWPALDQLETLFRRKMRLGPPVAEDFAIDKTLPADCKLVNRRDLGFPQNPRLYKSPTALRLGLADLWAADLTGIVRAWAAVIDPAETQVFVFQVGEGVKTSDLAVRLRKASASSKHLSIREKGSIITVVRGDRAEDAEFNAVDAIVRAKLRLK
ncbi:MAG: serine/threonine protein kinase, partial [Planctomycetaceae bacterium]|nr:serine/threonine protein kinase [Planctomycetaceae bacterium]